MTNREKKIVITAVALIILAVSSPLWFMYLTGKTTDGYIYKIEHSRYQKKTSPRGSVRSNSVNKTIIKFWFIKGTKQVHSSITLSDGLSYFKNCNGGDDIMPYGNQKIRVRYSWLFPQANQIICVDK